MTQGSTRRTAPTTEELDRAVVIWSRVVQTQEHFNDICMRVRGLYSTLVGAILAAYGFLIQNSKQNLLLGEVHVNAIIPLALAGWLVASLFYFVDRYWYHALLLGAVDQGREIEERWGVAIPDLKMGDKITARSPVDLSAKRLKYILARWVVSDPRLATTKKLHSDAKIEIFYKPVSRIMFGIALFSLLFGGLSFSGKSVFVLTRDWTCRLVNSAEHEKSSDTPNTVPGRKDPPVMPDAKTSDKG